MPHIFPKVSRKTLGECSDLELVRIFRQGSPKGTFAICGLVENNTRMVVLLPNGEQITKPTLMPQRLSVDVISYGSDYLINVDHMQIFDLGGSRDPHLGDFLYDADGCGLLVFYNPRAGYEADLVFDLEDAKVRDLSHDSSSFSKWEFSIYSKQFDNKITIFQNKQLEG